MFYPKFVLNFFFCVVCLCVAYNMRKFFFQKKNWKVFEFLFVCVWRFVYFDLCPRRSKWIQSFWVREKEDILPYSSASISSTTSSLGFLSNDHSGLFDFYKIQTKLKDYFKMKWINKRLCSLPPSWTLSTGLVSICYGNRFPL